jgi:hypothetical protein
MMYEVVAEAIEESGTAAPPQDYFNFYCLGNREPAPPMLNSQQCRRSRQGRVRRRL